MKPSTNLRPQLSPELLTRLQPSQNSDLSKVRQLYLALYTAIAEGELPFAHVLPSSRDLAGQLGIARNTVIAVYHQLDDEGMLHSAGRKGTVVNYQKPEPSHACASSHWPRSSRGQQLQPAATLAQAFSPGQPDSSLFPREAWRRALQKAAALPTSELGYQNDSCQPLKLAIARYLATYRSLPIAPTQIVVTASTRQSLLLAATLFADIGDNAWVESPGYAGAYEAFNQSGLVVHPCHVDEHGLQLAAQALPPRLIYTTPCFQYPTGVPLAPARREQLLALSTKHDCVVFEDDYDSEFRDNSQPRAALAASTPQAKVLHAGTFSKLMFPAVRVAWLVVPEDYATQAHACLRALGGGHNTVAQTAVAELLDNGSIAKHLQRARYVYAQRRRALLENLQASTLLHAAQSHAGSLSMVVKLPQALSTQALTQALQQNQLGAKPFEQLQWDKPENPHCKALVLGLGNIDILQIPNAVQRLESAIVAARL